MKENLVIVESPAKARTLSRILGKGYSLKASLGHIRDLPKGELGVDIENGFVPKYVVPRKKSKVVQELKQAANTASTVYLATDPDREGEAISWHLAEVIKSNRIPYRRVVFHQITKEAVEHAFRHPRSIDMQLVNAQQARRILDRLVGYKISPLLWRKVRRGLSAGRVQSVALRIIVDREREIEKFVPVEYWTIEAELTKKIPTAEGIRFRAMLVGLIDGTKLDIHNREEAAEISDKLKLASYNVIKVSSKKVTRQPPPPFITSTLQQEAWRKLHFNTSLTMAVAQQLYEGLPIGEEGRVGLITYMRTDSTQVASSAVAEAREFISSKYGCQFLPPHPRSFTRIVKGAQEAHEAIRPTKIEREPSLIKPYLTANQFKLYELIWKRMVASQMSVATFDNTAVDIEAILTPGTGYLFRTSTSVITFPGFTLLYTEDGTEKQKSSLLPKLEKGDELELLDLFPEQHFTQPPPRFTEATLVKRLEQWGIGRPSTYAQIVSTIQERGYVTQVKGSFQPTELGFVVNDLLGEYFPDIVDVEFTARMEQELDEIANENRDWVNVVQDFYIPLERSLNNASLLMARVKLAEEITEEICPQCG
ncbi:type I DNA topoisomerase, partial [Dehalococcoidales bacterium]|nr:type I DNA topoisomerase [Dehalococcoidales bacterium]